MTPGQRPERKPQAVENTANGNGTFAVQHTVTQNRFRARHVSPELRQMICDEFEVAGSTQDLADKWRLPRRVVIDIILLGKARKQMRGAA